MARKIVTYTVTAEGRDKGKTFVLTEMSATQAHKWATKAIFAVLNSGVEMPDEMLKMGLAGFAMMGIGAITDIPFAVAEPLLDELMTCVQIQQQLATRRLVEEDIEEPWTIFELQGQAFTLHVGPFISAVRKPSPSSPTTPAPVN